MKRACCRSMPAVDLDAVRRHLASISTICAGGDDAGPIGKLSTRERFDWLVAPRSTIIQTSAVHSGRCDDVAATLEQAARHDGATGWVVRTQVKGLRSRSLRTRDLSSCFRMNGARGSSVNEGAGVRIEGGEARGDQRAAPLRWFFPTKCFWRTQQSNRCQLWRAASR